MNQTSHDDPATAPHPGGGWSSRVLRVESALIVPATVPDMIQPAGVFDAAGAYLHEAVLWRQRPLMVEPPRPQAQARLAGRWIWGGVLLNHFGHFLTESTGRLWAVDAAAGADGIVFISKRGEADESGEIAVQPYHKLFFALMQIGLPLRIVTAPTEVEVLEVPGQGFGLGAIAAGTSEFRAFAASRFARDVPDSGPVAGPEKVYISRSELGPAKGGVLEEARIESFLAAQGYHIFHPQKHTLDEQVALYKGARRIVALDGSALHLVAMLCRPDQQVAVIRRRDSGASNSIVAHLSAFMGSAPQVFDVIVQDWVRSDRKRADRFSIGELDFAALAEKLVAAGFAAPGATMPRLSADEAKAAIRAVEEKLGGGKLRFEARGRGDGKRPRPVQVGVADPAPNPRREQRRALRAAARQV